VDSDFANGVKSAMAVSLADGDGTEADWESRIEITDISAGSIVVTAQITPVAGQTASALKTVVDNTLVADVNAGSFVVTVDGVDYTATEIETKIVDTADDDDEGWDLDLDLVAMALGIILLLAIGIPCLCCGIGIILFFKCIKGKDQQPQGQQQGATQFV
jgi:hypothetical protein